MWNNVPSADNKPKPVQNELALHQQTQPTNRNAQEESEGPQRLPAYAGRNRQESRKGHHAPMPAHLRETKGLSIYARVGNSVLSAARLDFLVANHRRGNEFQGNKRKSELFQLDSWSYLGKHQTYMERVSLCPTLSYVRVMNWDILETQRILQSTDATAASQTKHQPPRLFCWPCNSLSKAASMTEPLYKQKRTSDVTSTVDWETATRFCFPGTASCSRMQNSFCVEGKSVVWLHVKPQLWEDDTCEWALPGETQDIVCDSLHSKTTKYAG